LDVEGGKRGCSDLGRKACLGHVFFCKTCGRIQLSKGWLGRLSVQWTRTAYGFWIYWKLWSWTMSANWAADMLNGSGYYESCKALKWSWDRRKKNAFIFRFLEERKGRTKRDYFWETNKEIIDLETNKPPLFLPYCMAIIGDLASVKLFI
jgi:hypothetical protein